VRDKLVVSIKNKTRNRNEKEKKRMDSRLRGNDIKGSGNDPSEARLHGASIMGSGNYILESGKK